MKSFLLTVAFLLSCGLISAEEMKFVTLLSQPVGSFSRVEIVDDSEPAEIFHLNFCTAANTLGGQIKISGTGTADDSPVQAEKLRVLSDAILGGNVKEFAVDTMNVEDDASFVGGTLEVTGVAAPARIIVQDGTSNQHEGTAVFFHSNNVKINNANFYTMDITDTAVLSYPATGDTRASLGWKQLYQENTTEDQYPQAYVLTSHSGIESDDAIKFPIKGDLSDSGLPINGTVTRNP